MAVILVGETKFTSCAATPPMVKDKRRASLVQLSKWLPVIVMRPLPLVLVSPVMPMSSGIPQHNELSVVGTYEFSEHSLQDDLSF